MSNGKLLIINGPGLSDLSDHNEVANDDLSLSVIEQKCIETSGKFGLEVDFRQNDDESELLRALINDINNFDDNQAVLVIASKLLLIAAMFQISDSIQVVILGALRGLQDVRIPTIITFVSYWLIGFPVSYYLGDDRIFGSIGIWIGLLAGLTASSIFLYFRFDYLSKQFISKKSK